MAIKVKNSGAYADITGVFHKRAGTYEAVQGVYHKAGGVYGRVDAAPITLLTPTWSDDFSSYADGTRLVAGDANTDTGLVNANPGNLGWDSLTSIAPTTARFDPVIFQGVVRRRTTNGNGDFTAPGTYVLAPAGTLTAPAYAQMSVQGTAQDGQRPTINMFATDQANRLGLEILTSNGTAGTASFSLVSSGTTTTPASFASFNTKLRIGGINGSFVPWRAAEKFTGLFVDGRAYARRGPGFPLGPTTGTAITIPGGNRFGFSTNAGIRANRIEDASVGAAALFITVDETHRFWVPKKRVNASDPITSGVGDETFTGTYVGTIPSKMQWALFNIGTGGLIKEWTLVPSADFSASAGTWSARIRAIPAGLNGRGAYAVGFRPVDAENQTSEAWQCVSNREFYVTLNIGFLGQSNAFFFGQNVAGANYPTADGLTTYTKDDPPSLTPGVYTPRPRFWSDTTSFGASACTRVLADYLADLYDLPISCEILAISATGAINLGPNGVNWSYIQTHHAFAGGAYDLLYLSQGENEFTSGVNDWLNTWVNINLPAYRDPAMHGQPAGTVIPLLYTITGRFTGVPGGTDANAQTLRVAQYQLESSVSDCYLAHSYTGVEMIDTFHYVATNGEGYNEVARRIKLTYDKVFNSGSYDGRGPIATSVSRSGAVLTVSFVLNGATSLTTRDGRDQTLGGTAASLTSWQVSADDFATTLTISSTVQSGNTVVITLASDPGSAVKVRNHYGLNPDLTNWVSGSYADGTFIGMMPLVNALTSN